MLNFRSIYSFLCITDSLLLCVLSINFSVTYFYESLWSAMFNLQTIFIPWYLGVDYLVIFIYTPWYHMKLNKYFPSSWHEIHSCMITVHIYTYLNFLYFLLWSVIWLIWCGCPPVPYILGQFLNFLVHTKPDL